MPDHNAVACCHHFRFVATSVASIRRGCYARRQAEDPQPDAAASSPSARCRRSVSLLSASAGGA
eukprot:scaffold31891_cov112-Isochrysis_galbana.AAC.1